MVHFNFYLREKLSNSGYGQVLKHDTENDLFLASPLNERIWVCYLDAPIEPEMIRRYFDFPGHVLFVVDEKLIPDEIADRKSTPMWLRVLHGLYMGRVYTWNGRYLFGLHFDYDSGDVSESGIIQPDELLLTESGTWLRGWTGTYKLARFYDKRWWNESPFEQWDHAQQQRTNQKKSKQQSTADENTKWRDQTHWDKPPPNSNARTDYEQARDHYWEQQRAREQQYQQERERAQRQQYDADGFAYDPNDWPGGKPPSGPAKPDFMREFARAGSPSAVKALYRTLAKQYHPDLNPGVDTTEIMKQINIAYERYS